MSNMNRYLHWPIYLVIAGSLLTGNWFYYPSSAGLYCYSIAAALLAIVAGIALLRTKTPPPRAPFFVFLLYTAYLFVNTSLHQSPSYPAFWSLSNFIFFATLVLLPPQTEKLYLGLSFLATLESLICIAQYLQLIPGYNPLFTVTGTLENPNVTAMFLALCWPAALDTRQHTQGTIKKLTPFILILLLLALLLLRCRTAFIGIIVITLVFIARKIRKTISKHRSAAVLISAATLIIAIPLSIYLYQAKKASADGRKLIWSLSTRMIGDNVATGIGYGNFQQQFNLRQAAYIRDGHASPEQTRNAGVVYTAYNEYLQNGVEGGAPGLLLYLALLISLLILPLKQLKQTPDGKLISAFSAIAGFAVMSLINFTTTAFPVMALFSLYAAILTGNAPRPSINPAPILSYGCAGFLVLAGAWLAFTQLSLASADNKNHQAKLLIAGHHPNQALRLLPDLTHTLSGYESFWKNYGYALVAARKYDSALPILAKAHTLITDPRLFMATGYCYTQLGDYRQAASEYREAVYLEPMHFGARSSLAEICLRSGDTIAAIAAAREILTLDPKIPSDQVVRYKMAAATLLKQLHVPLDSDYSSKK